MPRSKVERVLRTENGLRFMEKEAAAGGGTKETVTVPYVIPDTPAAFLEMVKGASESPDGGEFKRLILQDADAKDDGESPLAFLHRLTVAAIERMATSRVYEAVEQKSTSLMINGERVNVMEFPLKRLVRAINGAAQAFDNELMIRGLDAESASDEDKASAAKATRGYTVMMNAKDKLIEQGKVKVNDASGMVEAVEQAA